MNQGDILIILTLDFVKRKKQRVLASRKLLKIQ